MRTLGSPWVSVGAAAGSPNEVRITVAWELSWYQWGVDVEDEGRAVFALDKGGELAQLDGSARHWNGGAAEGGRLFLGGPAAGASAAGGGEPGRMKVVVNVDGGARGNPGPAAIAAVVQDAERRRARGGGERIGTATNNVAEYRALLLGIERAAAIGATELELVGDSELIVRQVEGRYKVKDAALRELHAEVKSGSRGLRRDGRSATSAASTTPRPTGSSTRRSMAAEIPEPIDPGVDIGHVHLKVADIDRALDFYCGVLGFELQQRIGEEAAFVSAGGYHHHIGLNTWHSKGGSPPPPGSTGLFHTAIRYPTRRSLAVALQARRRGRRPAQRRLRPRRQRGALPHRPRRQRGRALLGPAARGVAAAAGRGGGDPDGHRPPRPPRPAGRARRLGAEDRFHQVGLERLGAGRQLQPGKPWARA